MKIDKNFDELTAMELYFLYLDEDKFIDALEDFSNKVGYGISEFICCAFPPEYESWEEGYFGDTGVKFEVEPPAVDGIKYEIVSNTDFIDFLDNLTHQYLVSYPMEQSKVELLLNQIKTKLL
ncbi:MULTISPECIES: ribonuclease toxin immunity protein CdiI [Paenibacillus]|uniref:CDI immunity protein domain-containing protein n=1 Tax=Paenibacillus vini TaxID=1476024 RepID=A0ABQ4MJD2_9BACL|nr:MULTISPECIES: ribonuclease toxin immunity protein CdiI [Paenibacillus]MBQ4899976.1 hypothetical protein [Paenibacillus sp. Marseille-P2973]MDN4066497.1 ribonuclease toxin immunity protein CdiI [Paenibacillus vini]GIP56092.1 hypothetical protein J42TS3_51270 [Paenibacillus vini]